MLFFFEWRCGGVWGKVVCFAGNYLRPSINFCQNRETNVFTYVHTSHTRGKKKKIRNTLLFFYQNRIKLPYHTYTIPLARVQTAAPHRPQGHQTHLSDSDSAYSTLPRHWPCMPFSFTLPYGYHGVQYVCGVLCGSVPGSGQLLHYQNRRKEQPKPKSRGSLVWSCPVLSCPQVACIQIKGAVQIF